MLALFTGTAQTAAAGDLASNGDLGRSAPVSMVRPADRPPAASAFDTAVTTGRSAEAREILSRLAAGSPELQDALETACRAGQTDLAAAALAGGADVTGRNTLLTYAAGKNNADLVRLLLDYGADASLAPAAVREAVKHRNISMASLLLDAGADPNDTAENGESAASLALAAGDVDLAKVMFRHGGSPDAFVEPAMKTADVALLGALFQYGLSPDKTDAGGNPLVLSAALAGQFELVKFLLANGADAKKPGREGQAALHFAVVTKNDNLLTTLLESGADPNQPFFSPVKEEFLARIDDERFKKWLKRDNGLTPLMLAASRGDTGMLRQLIDKGARRGLQTKNWKRYPVVFACENEHIPAAQILLGRNPAPDEPRYSVTIFLSKQRAILYKDGQEVRSSRVSTGRKGYATPTGKFVITDKQRDWISTIYNVSMPFFMRLNCREIGLHAGNCPGYPASHGCIRMPRADVQVLFSKLKIGDPVTIVD